MFVRVASAAVIGIEAAPIDVEVDVGVGLPCCNIVGLPDAGIREGRLRIRGALDNSGFKLPPRRTTVNLAPADLRKDGASEKEIRDLLSTYASSPQVMDIDVMNTHTYLNVAPADAERIIGAVTGKEMAGRQLICETAKPRRR